MPRRAAALAAAALLPPPAPARAQDAGGGKDGYHNRPLPLAHRGGLREYSVVYTDRSVNHMSTTFQQCMLDLHGVLTRAYNAKRAVIIPGSGSYAMEAVARQLAENSEETREKGSLMVLRLGYFSYRWTDILDRMRLPHTVLKARPSNDATPVTYAPPPVADVVAAVRRERPAVFFAPHVETSTGLILPPEYIREVAAAVRGEGGHFVLDGIAAGYEWADMEDLGVDFYLTAPQKGWTGPASAGIVMMSPRGYDAVTAAPPASSLVLDLRKWRDVMEKYLDGSFAYHTTMPTDSLLLFRDAAVETETLGFARARGLFRELGERVRASLARRGFPSVAAAGWQAPGVIVVYSDTPGMVARARDHGVQLAAGVGWQLGEGDGVGAGTFRIGLFGIDKIADVDGTVAALDVALDAAAAAAGREL